MLGKLFKHEWKSIYKVGCILLILIAVDTFFGWLAFQSPMWKLVTGRSSHGGVSVFDIMSMMTLVLYMILLAGASFGILIYLGVHFYHSMYTDEGYLTFTLPVKKSRILLSKILADGLWMLIITLAVYASVAVLVGTVCNLFLSGGLWRYLSEFRWEILDLLRSEFGFDVTLWAVILVISSIVGPFCSLIILYGAISIGQLFPKHRVLMAIVSYAGIVILSMILNSVTQSIYSTHMLSQTLTDSYILNSYVDTNSITSLLLEVVMAVLLYLASYLITEKKLNLE